MDETFDLARFESYREGNRLEVKAANGGLPGTLWETYSSFANSYGGCIICGIAEKKDGSWRTTGLKNIEQLKKALWDTVHNKTKVSQCLISESDVEDYTVGNDVILVVKVPRARRAQKPVYINNDVFGATFRRDHEGDYHCTESEIRAMIRDSFEETPDLRVLNRKIDFNKETIRSYRIRYNNRHEESAWAQLSDEDFLVRIGALNDEGEKLRPTAAGLLMFGVERRITDEYPEYFLDYREYMDSDIRWTDRIHSQDPEWSGNVFEFYSRVSAKLVLDLKRPFNLVDQVRIDETPLHDAVREALVNCLVNADFYQGWSVVIEKYPDKIVMANPGTIIAGQNQMLKGGISQPRNKGLFKMFNLIGLGEHAGSGVPDIYKAWREAGLDEPVVEEKCGDGKPDRTILTLPLVISENSLGISEKQPENSPEIQPKITQREKIDKRIESVLAVIMEKPSISRNEISKTLGISDSKVKTAIEKMKQRGIIHREGSDTNGKWIIDKYVSKDNGK